MAELSADKLLKKMRHLLRLDKMSPTVRKGVVIIIGGIFLVGGVVMMVAPGPAFIVIPLGFLLLATEFKWAERWADKAFELARRAKQKFCEFRRRRTA